MNSTIPHFSHRCLIVLLAALLGLLSTRAAHAQIKVLTSLGGSYGSYPKGGLITDGTNLYGTTTDGGVNGNGTDGTVFSLPLSGGTPTVVVNFPGVNKGRGIGDLVLSGNTLYGTTVLGGANGGGSVFSVPVSGGTLTTLASFLFSGANGTNPGVNPMSGVILSGNTLYGTTNVGGLDNQGTVFAFNLATNTFTQLGSFTGLDGNGGNGSEPSAGLTLIGSTLYGTTEYGGTYSGSSSNGVVFSVPASGGIPTVLASFNGANGQNPVADLTPGGNFLYGTTEYGGADNAGTVFAFNLTTNTITTLVSFTGKYGNGTGGNGQNPVAGVILSGNTLYGTTEFGGANGDGTVFALDLATNSLTTLASFNSTNGSGPYGNLLLVGNTLYGTTVDGGTNNSGTVFSLQLPFSGTDTPVMPSWGLAVLALLLLGIAAQWLPKRQLRH